MPDATLEKDQIFPKLCGNQSFIGLKGKLLTAFRKRIDKCRFKKDLSVCSQHKNGFKGFAED
jgi:hypothetical protein